MALLPTHKTLIPVDTSDFCCHFSVVSDYSTVLKEGHRHAQWLSADPVS